MGDGGCVADFAACSFEEMVVLDGGCFHGNMNLPPPPSSARQTILRNIILVSPWPSSLPQLSIPDDIILYCNIQDDNKDVFSKTFLVETRKHCPQIKGVPKGGLPDIIIE